MLKGNGKPCQAASTQTNSPTTGPCCARPAMWPAVLQKHVRHVQRELPPAPTTPPPLPRHRTTLPPHPHPLTLTWEGYGGHFPLMSAIKLFPKRIWCSFFYLLRVNKNGTHTKREWLKQTLFGQIMNNKKLL